MFVLTIHIYIYKYKRRRRRHDKSTAHVIFIYSRGTKRAFTRRRVVFVSFAVFPPAGARFFATWTARWRRRKTRARYFFTPRAAADAVPRVLFYFATLNARAVAYTGPPRRGYIVAALWTGGEIGGGGGVS